MADAPSIPKTATRATRFAGLRPFHAALILLAMLLLAAIGIMQPPPRVGGQQAPVKIVGSDRAADPAGDDILLYRVIVDKVRAGKDYHAATAKLLRDNDYPLRPFIAFRLPTLAVFLASIPEWLGSPLLVLLAAAVIMTWTRRIGMAGASERQTMYASLLLLAGCVTAASPSLTAFHESWSALLVALAFATHRADRWWPAVLIGLLAVMIREIALPFILLMAAGAIWRRAWGEAGAWIACTILFGVAMLLHAQAVAQVVLPGDPASPGWVSAGGWPFVIASVRGSTMLGFLPIAFTAFAVPLALIGWLGRRDANGTLTALFLTGFAVMMTVLGRPNNFYWAMMMVPALLAGLAFAPAALRDLAGSLRAEREPTPSLG